MTESRIILGELHQARRLQNPPELLLRMLLVITYTNQTNTTNLQIGYTEKY